MSHQQKSVCQHSITTVELLVMTVAMNKSIIIKFKHWVYSNLSSPSELLVPLCPLSLSLWLYSPLDLGRFFSFLILYTFGSTPWTGDQTATRPLPTHRTTQTQNKRTHTYMPRVGFEPTIPVLNRANTVHALDRAASVIGSTLFCWM
jgi:hypothetical protein